MGYSISLTQYYTTLNFLKYYSTSFMKSNILVLHFDILWKKNYLTWLYFSPSMQLVNFWEKCNNNFTKTRMYFRYWVKRRIYWFYKRYVFLCICTDKMSGTKFVRVLNIKEWFLVANWIYCCQFIALCVCVKWMKFVPINACTFGPRK